MPVFASPKTSVCIDETVNYSLVSPTPGIIYTWSISNTLGTITGGQGTPNITVLWHGGSPLTGTLSVSNCSGTTSVGITVTLPVNVSISQTPTGSCGGGSCQQIQLTANPSGQTYLWNTAPFNTQSVIINALGTYTVIVNAGSAGSCAVTKSVTVKPTCYEHRIVAPCSVTNCGAGATVPLTQLFLNLPGPGTYQWYGTIGGLLIGETNSSYNAPVNVVDCYYCVATNTTTNCTATSNTICVPNDIDFCCPNASCGSLTYGIDFTLNNCNPVTVNAFYTGTGSASGGFPMKTCWGDAVKTQSNTLTDSHVYGQAGVYTVCVMQKTLVPRVGGGFDTCCINACKNDTIPVVADFNASYNCATGLLSMTDNSSYYPNSTGATYNWSITGGTYSPIVIGTTASEQVTPTSSGTFIITLNVTLNGCTSSSVKVVNVALPNAAFTANPNPTCSGGNTTFVAGTPGFANYYWQFGDGNYSYMNPSLGNPIHTYTSNTPELSLQPLAKFTTVHK